MPADTAIVQRALLALDGLSVGDAFGERFFAFSPLAFRVRVESQQSPQPPWKYTDDTVMALGILEVLQRVGYIDQDDLAATFARRYDAEPNRGYGAGAHHILSAIDSGAAWHVVSSAVFEGTGSLGNGGAMRVAPLGAWFADDIDRLIVEARRSAEVTHWHPEGQAGAIASAVAAAFAWNERRRPEARAELLRFVADRTPAGATHDGLVKANGVPFDTAPREAAFQLGNGSRISAPDTVPFALWCAARHLDDYPAALWSAVSVGGDIDTNCAIVGGIVALSAQERCIPPEWLQAREPLALDGAAVSVPRR